MSHRKILLVSLLINISKQHFTCTGGPRYMRSFYLQFRVYAIENRPFLRNFSPNLQASLVFLYANSLYASLIFWSLSLAYNEVHLYIQNVVEVLSGTRIHMIISDTNKTHVHYRVFHRFRRAKFDNDVPILSSSQVSLLTQLPKKMKLAFKVVKIDSK